MNTKQKIFLVVFLFAIVLGSVVWLPKYGMWEGTTDIEYQVIAENILNDKGYSFENEKTMFREPVYPFILFLNYKIFGVNNNVIRFEQFVLLLLVCFLTYKIAEKYFNEVVAQIAVLAIALHPVFLIYTTDISSEVFAILFVVLFCWFFLKSVEEENLFFPLLVGLFLALLVLTKSIFIFVPLFVIGFYLSRLKNQRSPKILLFVLGFLILVLPWSTRNKINFDTFALAERGGLVSYVHTSRSLLGGEELKNYMISAFTSQYFVRLGNPEFDIANVNIMPANEKKAELLEKGFSGREIDIWFGEESKRLWREYPIKNFLVGFLELSKLNSPTVPKDSIMFVYSVGGGKLVRFLKGCVILGIRVVWLFVLGLMVYGICRSFKLKKYDILSCAFLIFYLNGVIFFLEGVPRFVMPIYSLYFIFASFGLYSLLKRNLKTRRVIDALQRIR